jgi:hypothetical protein
MSFVYSVKFICGTQNPPTTSNPCTPVRQGIYSTEVNIHNFHPVGTPPAVITKLALLLVHNDAPVGREPRFAPAAPPFANITLQPGTATMDDCCSLLGPLNLSLAQLNIGFLVLQSTVSLNVAAVYTATDLHSGSISIDVQSINERQV